MLPFGKKTLSFVEVPNLTRLNIRVARWTGLLMAMHDIYISEHLAIQQLIETCRYAVPGDYGSAAG